jgi:uncharacterized protein involved in response to NO
MNWALVAEKIKKDPFRIFFPLGWALAIFGVLFWIPFAWGEPSFYPGGFHAVLMSRGFLSSFILGFLMTAIPRFTETENARGWEVAIGIASILGIVFVAPYGRVPISSALTLFQIAVIAAFIGRRFSKRKNNPPGTFVFVGVGLTLGATGSLLEFLSLSDWISLSPNNVLLGKLLSFYAMVLALVLGVGSRLFPGILGWSEIVQAQRQQYEQPVSFLRAVPRDLLIGAALFILSFFLEVYFEEKLGRSLRAILVLYVAIRYWRLHRKPPKTTWMNWMLVAAAWSIVIGEILSAVFPDWGLDGKHMVFVGGFSLLVFLVSGRVTLAHGGDLNLERRRWPYLPLTVFILVSSLARTAVHWTPENYFSHLGYAAMLWLIGAIFWGVFFLPRMVKGLSRK